MSLLRDGNWRTLVTLMALYAGQGLLVGLWAAIVVPTLQRQGVTLHEMIGTLAWGGLPWVLKAPAAPMVDRLFAATSGVRRRTKRAFSRW